MPMAVVEICATCKGGKHPGQEESDHIDLFDIPLSFFNLLASGNYGYDVATINLWKATYFWYWFSLGLLLPWLSGLSRGLLAPGKALTSLAAASAHWKGKFSG